MHQTSEDHDTIKHQLARELRSYARYHEQVAGLESPPRVEKEVTHHSDSLPSEKSTCRSDIELEVNDTVYAFEVKMSEADLKNWFLQRQDYIFVGLEPVLVLSETLAYEIAPHQEKTLRDSYVVYTNDKEWWWNAKTEPANIEKVFETDKSVSIVDQCPYCKAWTECRFPVVQCVSCDWSRTVSTLL